MKIAIIGAGINGLAVGIKLLETLPNALVTIIGERVTPDTTSDTVAGFWTPYAIAGNDSRLEGWAHSTYDFLSKIIQTNPDHHKYGLYYQEMYELSDDKPIEMKLFNEVVESSRFMNERELKRFPTAKYGIASFTILSEGQKILAYLSEKFTASGGIIETHRAESFNEVHTERACDIVINCSGLGSRELCHDLETKPVRLQIVRVDAPWIKSAVWLEDRFYILPQSDGVVALGGKTSTDIWDSSPNDQDTQYILNGCMKLLPGLKNSKIISVKVGLQSQRANIRLECEEKINETTGMPYKLIHNYGQGDAAFTLFWGCAEDVAQIVSDILLNKNK